MRVIWSEESRFDLASIEDRLALTDPDIAEQVSGAAIQAGRFLSEHPRAGPNFSNVFLRKWRVPGTPYLIIYHIRRDAVHVLRIMHDRSDWQSL